MRISSDLYQCDAVVVRTTVLQPVDPGLVSPSRVAPKDFEKILTAPLLGNQHDRASVENKPASSLASSLSKTLNMKPPFLRGKNVMGKSRLPVKG